MIPKTFYISDIYESFLAVMLFLFLPVIVIPVVWPKNHFLFVRNWLRFWILPSGWNFIKSHRKWIILGWILQEQCFVMGFFYFCFYHYNYYWGGGGVFTLFPCVCILCSLWNIKSISVFETRKKVYFIKIFLTLTKVFIS